MREPDPALTTREYWDRLRDAHSHPPPRESWVRRVRRRLHLINLLGHRDLVNRLTSPHLVCIGTRRAPAAHGARPD